MKGINVPIAHGPADGPLRFPCAFPIKVLGLNTAAFERAVQEVLRRHVREAAIAFETRMSRGGKYLSVTATIAVESKEQLDAVYRELNAHELVVMTL